MKPGRPKARYKCQLCGVKQVTIKGMEEHIGGPPHYMSPNTYRNTFPGSLPDEEFTVREQEQAQHQVDSEDFIKNKRKEFLNDVGYLPGPLVEETLLLMDIRRKLEERYQKMTTGNLDLIKPIRDTSKHITTNIAQLDAQKALATSGDDISILYRATLDQAENYIKEHIGEHTFMCSNCNTVVTASGLPHWALDKAPDGSHLLWNQEMAEDVSAGKIELWQMARYLRTSIEAVIYCAEKRGYDFGKKFLKERQENKLREAMLADV